MDRDKPVPRRCTLTAKSLLESQRCAAVADRRQLPGQVLDQPPAVHADRYETFPHGGVGASLKMPLPTHALPTPHADGSAAFLGAAVGALIFSVGAPGAFVDLAAGITWLSSDHFADMVLDQGPTPDPDTGRRTGGHRNHQPGGRGTACPRIPSRTSSPRAGHLGEPARGKPAQRRPTTTGQPGYGPDPITWPASAHLASA